MRTAGQRKPAPPGATASAMAAADPRRRSPEPEAAGPQPAEAERQDGRSPDPRPDAVGRKRSRLQIVGGRDALAGTARTGAGRADRSGRGADGGVAHGARDRGSPPGTDAPELSIAERIDRISERLLEVRPAEARAPEGKARAKVEWRQNANRVVARLIKLLPVLRAHGDLQLVVNAGIAVEHLLKSPPNLGLAAEIVDDLRGTMGLRTPASFYLMAGMVLFMVTALVVFLALSTAYAPEAWRHWYAVAIFGGLGSIASIASRFSEYRTIYANSATHLVGHGLTKPLLGVILGLFVAVVIHADLLPLEDGASRPALSMAFAFIAGFSERFARDVAGRVEGLAGGSPASQARQS